MKLSKKTEEAIRDCRLLAERYRNNFISGIHFYLIYSKYRLEETEPSLPYHYKKAFINYLLQSKAEAFNKEADIFLTVHFEKAIQYSNFHKWLLNKQEIEPINLLFSLIEDRRESKLEYQKYFEVKSMQLSGTKKIAFELYYNPVIRLTGLVRLFKLF